MEEWDLTVEQRLVRHEVRGHKPQSLHRVKLSKYLADVSMLMADE